jgi:zinc protease
LARFPIIRVPLALAALSLAGSPAVAQPAAPTPAKPWLYAGSDIPVDSAWTFGTLPNGVRYAIRRNALPAHSLSIRVRIDAGALMERDDEQGYAHFIEHMAFRGTKDVPDGEGIRIWQRLGANFGTDTNAYTTNTQTVYAIDLPKADPEGIDTGLKVVAGMMENARIDPAAVDIERKVVIAERDLRLPPLQRRQEQAAKSVWLTGTRAAHTEVTGTDSTLGAATAARLHAFYDRWYRPERTIVTIVGDADPAALETALARYFGTWTGRGPAPAEPDYGKPARPAMASAIVSDPQAVSGLTLLWPSQHDDRPWTLARQQAEDIRAVATRILSRRLTRKAREGASFTGGGAGFSESRHVLDTAIVAIQPKQGLWRQALDETYALLADAVATPPSQEEIDREVADLDQSYQARTAAVPTTLSPTFADELVLAANGGDVVAEPRVYAKIFADTRPVLTPANVGAAMRGLVAGDPRALMTSPQPVAGGDAALASALTEAKTVKAAARTEQSHVSLADLGSPGAPGRIVSRTTIPDLGITRIRFANGVRLDVKPTPFDKDRILVEAMVGNGLAGLDPGQTPPAWTASVITQSGFGPWDAEAVGRALAGHRIGLGFGMVESAFVWSGATDRAELTDQLRVLATAIREPRFDAAALERQRTAFAENYDSLFANPSTVYGTFAGEALHRGDKRFAAVRRPDIAAMNFDRFRAFWRPLIAAGPRRVVIVGDVDLEQAIEAARRTFGAAPTRAAVPLSPAHLALLPPAPGTPALNLEHRGDPNQWLIATIWSTTGALADLPESRAMNVAAEILSTRLYDRFREKEGGTYTPGVGSGESLLFPRYGIFSAYSQIRADRVGDFNKAVREIVADLVRTGPTPDELARAVAPIVSGNERARQTNAYWFGLLNEDIDDPRILAAARTSVSGYQAVTAEAVRAAAAHWLSAPPALTVVVKGRPAAGSAAAPSAAH